MSLTVATNMAPIVWGCKLEAGLAGMPPNWDPLSGPASPVPDAAQEEEGRRIVENHRLLSDSLPPGARYTAGMLHGDALLAAWPGEMGSQLSLLWYELGAALHKWFIQLQKNAEKLAAQHASPTGPGQAHHTPAQAGTNYPGLLPPLASVVAAARNVVDSAPDKSPLYTLRMFLSFAGPSASDALIWEGFRNSAMIPIGFEPGAGEYATLDHLLNHTRRDLLFMAQGRPPRPVWNKALGLLFFHDRLVKRLVPSKAVRVVEVLDEFDRLGWPDVIHLDPNSWYADNIHQTLRSLNDGLKVLRFHGSGVNCGVAVAFDGPIV